MHSSKMVKTAKPISRSLYTNKTRRGKKERKSFFVVLFCFVATAINRVFTDEVMQFALRGPQKEVRLVKSRDEAQK